MKKLILAAVLVAAVLTGCESDSEQAGVNVYPKITQYGGVADEYFYVVDERTGVIYLAYDSLYRRAITVALNADGTPVTKDQLEAWQGRQ